MINGSNPTSARRASLALAAVLVLMFVSVADISTADAGDWKGSETTVEGKKVMTNPTAGFKKPSTVEMEELWRLGGDTDDEDEFFGVIADIEIDAQGNVYLLDSQLSEVKIYSDDGEYLRSIGREGEGPGEFRRPGAMFFTDEGNVAVAQFMPGKIVVLTPEGDPVGDFPIPVPEDGGFQMIQGASAGGNNIVLLFGRQEFNQETGEWKRRSFIAGVNNKGDMLSEYTTKTNEINMAAAVLDDKAWDTFERRWTVGPDGKVYACTSYEDYSLSIWNADGSLDREITREYTHKPRPEVEQEWSRRLMGFYAKQIPNCEVKIEKMAKDIETIYVRDDGSIWVLTGDGARDLRKDGTMGVFDVYNPQGQFVRNVTLAGEGDPLDDLYLFVKDRFYVVTEFLQAAMSAQGVQDLYDEDDEEASPMAVICYKLDGDVLAAR